MGLSLPSGGHLLVIQTTRRSTLNKLQRHVPQMFKPSAAPSPAHPGLIHSHGYFPDAVEDAPEQDATLEAAQVVAFVSHFPPLY